MIFKSKWISIENPLQRIQNKVDQNTAKLQIWKYNKRDLDNVLFTDGSNFYLKVTPLINRSLEI